MENKGYHVVSKTADGLFIDNFYTPQGKIKVNLPDDMAAGDTISGTVDIEPAGKNDTERAQNQTELNGYVIEVEGTKAKAGDVKFIFVIPPTVTPAAKTIVLMKDNRAVARSTVPISPTPLMPIQITLPTGGQQGRTVQCRGPLTPTDHIEIGGKVQPVIAESPRQMITLNTSEVIGQTTIKCGQQECTFRNIGIKLSAPKLDLQRGETTTLHLVVMGLAGNTQDVPLDLVNNSPTIVNMAGGMEQHAVINPSAIQSDGTWSLDRTLTGIQPGGFVITGTVTWNDTCTGRGGGVIADGPGTAKPTPTPLTPTDTASGEVCTWIAYKTYRVDEWKREQSSDKDLEVRHGSAKGGGVTVEFHCKAAGTFTFTVTKETGSPDVVSVTCTQP
jgi:hypothetical protein